MKTLTLSLLFFCIGLQAQVGIGNTDPQATLDITSTTDGLLIPRVALTSTSDGTTVVTLTTSELVYNTATAGTSPNNVVPGYYYWNGTKWVTFTGGTSNDWSINGNSGTSAATNFLGTTDDVNLIFKRNNIQAGLLSAPSTAYGVNSLLASTGVWNTAIGETALQNTTTGHRNTAVGSGAMTDNTTGFQNTALGRYSLHFITTGFNNMAIGQEAAKWNSTGHDNTAIGFYALRQNGTGSYNIAIGRSANAVESGGDIINNVGDNNIVIGTGAVLPSPTSSNTMVLGSGSGAAVKNSLTGLSDPTATLTTIINGFITAPTTTNALITAEPTGKALVTKEFLATYAPLASPVFSGNIFFAQPAPTALTAATATLTIAQLLTKIITVTRNSGVTLTLPTGTLTDAGILSGTLPINNAFEWTIINLGSSSGIVTLAVGTNHTIVGLTTTPINSQSTWRTVKTGANTFVTYRVY